MIKNDTRVGVAWHLPKLPRMAYGYIAFDIRDVVDNIISDYSESTNAIVTEATMQKIHGDF